MAVMGLWYFRYADGIVCVMSHGIYIAWMTGMEDMGYGTWDLGMEEDWDTDTLLATRRMHLLLPALAGLMIIPIL